MKCWSPSCGAVPLCVLSILWLSWGCAAESSEDTEARKSTDNLLGEDHTYCVVQPDLVTGAAPKAYDSNTKDAAPAAVELSPGQPVRYRIDEREGFGPEHPGPRGLLMGRNKYEVTSASGAATLAWIPLTQVQCVQGEVRFASGDPSAGVPVFSKFRVRPHCYGIPQDVRVAWYTESKANAKPFYDQFTLRKFQVWASGEVRHDRAQVTVRREHLWESEKWVKTDLRHNQLWVSYRDILPNFRPEPCQE